MCVGACQGTTFYLSYTALPRAGGNLLFTELRYVSVQPEF